MVLMRHGYFYKNQATADNRLLDRSAYVLLRRIQLDGPMSISQLSEALGLDVSTLNRQTASMLKSGLVTRIPDPDGGIARKFRLSEEGSARVDEHREVNNRGLERVLENWTAEEVAEFAAALARFNGDIERLEKRRWPRPGVDPEHCGADD
ncbi:MarR family transcriptional regulator [Nakamurella silvestris]|nr:MarR family transcriptional regulator [Nakamurella silvestris]